MVWGVSAQTKRVTTRLEDDPVPGAQGIVAAASAVAAISLPFLRGSDYLALSYNPFAGLPTPEFAIFPAAMVLLAVWPVVFLAIWPGESASTVGQGVMAEEAPR